MPPACSHSGEIAGAVIGGENKRTAAAASHRHRDRAETLSLSVPVFAVSSFPLSMPLRNSSSREARIGRAACVLPVLLIVVQPKGGVNAYKHEDQFGCPAPNA